MVTTVFASSSKNMRRVNLRGDLSQIADLVELTFADTLDADGRRFIRQMRNTAKSPQMLGIGGYIPSNVSGFVWESEGMIVGNLNMIPISTAGQRSYLIANVAVHPDFRKRGIARTLTEAALNELRSRHVRNVWLQVRAGNEAAYHLYQSHGFEEIVRRTTWHSGKLASPAALPENMQVVERRKDDWEQQKDWLQAVYPKSLTWHLPLNISALSPSLGGKINRAFSERNFSQWSYVLNSSVGGVLTWQSSYTQADWLWLAADPAQEAEAITHLLPYAVQHAPQRRTMALNYPAGRGVEALTNIGFRAHQTLIWMKTALS